VVQNGNILVIQIVFIQVCLLRRLLTVIVFLHYLQNRYWQHKKTKNRIAKQIHSFKLYSKDLNVQSHTRYLYKNQVPIQPNNRSQKENLNEIPITPIKEKIKAKSRRRKITQELLGNTKLECARNSKHMESVNWKKNALSHMVWRSF